MQPIKDANRASRLFCEREWPRIIIWALIGFLFTGVWGIILGSIFIFILGTLSMMSKLLCTNNYRSGKCGNIVNKRKNFCDRCGAEVPDELKLGG